MHKMLALLVRLVYNMCVSKKETKEYPMTNNEETRSKLAKEVVVGNGIDRHLMALKIIAIEEGRVDRIPIFNNPMYSYSSDFLISSSNVTSPELSIFGFGATSANGYGVGYQILEDSHHSFFRPK